MPERDFTPTQSLLLELREERGGMQEGYRFLDEKRLILASEILRQLAEYTRGLQDFEADYAAAARALGAAVARHGAEGLEVYPADPPIAAAMTLTPRSVLGVTVHGLACALDEPPPAPGGPLASPEANHCREAFRALIPRAAHLAALAGNLERLRADYARTARRARALEDVLLPELSDTIASVAAALEESDREEAVRARVSQREQP
jgi:V/A-type H+-transporting ATPase subunit D